MREKNDQYELLDKYLCHSLDPAEAEEFEKLLLTEPELAAAAGLLRELRKDFASIEWDKNRSAAHSIFRQLLEDYGNSARQRKPEWGLVVFDSKYLPLPEGIRPALIDTRRIKYRVGDDFLELSLFPISPGSFEMIGRLSGCKHGEILKAEMLGGKVRLAAKSNEFQLFRFPRIPRGKYQLKIYRERKVKTGINIEL